MNVIVLIERAIGNLAPPLRRNRGMSPLRRLVAISLGAFVVSSAFAATAGAAGAPVPTSESGTLGAVAPGGSERFLAHRSGRGHTLVTVVSRSNGRVLRSRRVSGRWTIPAVTLLGGTTGLSGDGGTLVLARPTRSYPPSSSPLLVLDARSLRVRREIGLKGFFTVDAISPDGRWAYVIQYKDPNALDYRVRALDLSSGALAAKDVVDPRNPGEQMRGLPMQRLTSDDGRWAYTIYGGGTETFIHALDTVGRTAACIDLEMLPTDSDFSTVRLRISGGRLLVSDRGERVATVDRRTFAVSEPGEAAKPAAPRPASAAPAGDGGSGFPWLPVVLVALALGAVGIVAARVSGPFSRRSPDPPRA